VSLLHASEARRWEDVIISSIYAQSHIDIPRIQFSLEADPLSAVAAPTMYQSEPPSDAPSSVPSYYGDPNDEMTAQSSSSSNNNQASNNSVTHKCPSGEASYQIKKFDTWGDGWGETTISIRQVHSNMSLADGEAGNENVVDTAIDAATDADADSDFESGEQLLLFQKILKSRTTRTMEMSTTRINKQTTPKAAMKVENCRLPSTRALCVVVISELNTYVCFVMPVTRSH